MTVRFYSSVAQQETLTGSISAATTAISVSATTGFPSSTPFTLALDYDAPNEELVDVTAVAGSLLTVTRAVDGTSATSHNAGAVVRHVSSARDFSDSRNHENSSNAVHGITGAVVGTTDVQTLSNKTLTNTTFNSPTVTGTVTGGATYSGVTLSNNPVVTGNMDVNGTVAGTAQLDVMGAPSQSAALQRWLSSGGTTLASVTASGNIRATNGLDASTTNTLQVPIFAKGPASMASPYIDIQDSTSASLVNVDNNGKLSANKGATLVGDPSPSTGGVTIKAGPSSNQIAAFVNAAGSPQATVGTSGQFVGNDLTILNTAATSQWQGFTPLWTSTGTAPSIGNGTLTGRFYEQGKLVCATWLIQFGTTTTFGTGTWGFSYPSGRQPKQNTNALLSYSGAALGHSTQWYAGTANYNQGVDSFRIYSHATTTEWAPTVPVTWTAANTNYIEFSVVYEQV